MIYRLGYFILWGIFRFFLSLRVRGHQNIPARGAAIIACNHQSLADPPLLAVCLKRKDLYFIAKEELFRPHIAKMFFLSAHCIPIKRNRWDTEALGKALDELSKGRTLAIFPQGGRILSPAIDMDKIKPGIGYLAEKTRLPVIPAAIYYRRRKCRFPATTVIFGRARTYDDSVSPGSKDGWKSFTYTVMLNVRDIHTQKAREDVKSRRNSDGPRSRRNI